jgi:hypothetical protein
MADKLKESLEEYLRLGERMQSVEWSQPTDLLLASGGDDRLTLRLEKCGKINKYNCSTSPRSGIIARGSCTCSTMTDEVIPFQWLLFNAF